jgi:hypothetical protein
VTGSPNYLDRKLKYANYLHRKYQSGMLKRERGPKNGCGPRMGSKNASTNWVTASTNCPIINALESRKYQTGNAVETGIQKWGVVQG